MSNSTVNKLISPPVCRRNIFIPKTLTMTLSQTLTPVPDNGYAAKAKWRTEEKTAVRTITNVSQNQIIKS
jgi:hypothetical protein